jgi:tellurite resistance protein TerC
MDVPLWAWAAFGAVVVVMLAIDLFAHRRAHVIGFREAARWSVVWVGISLIFALILGLTLGPNAGVDFTTAWLLEKSLSVDNLFVFALIFGYFKVPREYQHRVLFFGVIGALVFRGIFLAAGVAIVSKFTAVLFVFAAILLYSAYKLIKDEDDSYDPGTSVAVRLLRKIVPVRDEYAGTKFFVKEAGRRVATPLLAVVVAIEAADLVFAVDSVPAVLAVSDDAFIVYSSNAFAILGLRALYFMLSGLLEKFHYLGKGLAIVLGFIGVKLVLQATHKVVSTSVPEIPSLVSLGVIVTVLGAAVLLSLWRPAEAADVVDGPGEDAVHGPGEDAVDGAADVVVDEAEGVDGAEGLDAELDGSRARVR